MKKENTKLYESYTHKEFFYTFQIVFLQARNKYDEYKLYYQNRTKELKKENIYVGDYDIYIAEIC